MPVLKMVINAFVDLVWTMEQLSHKQHLFRLQAMEVVQCLVNQTLLKIVEVSSSSYKLQHVVFD